jgi:predicted dehydrogenase
MNSKYEKYKFVLVGLGPHAKRIYISIFKKYKLNLALLIDLKSKKGEIEKYLKENNITTELFLVDDSYKDYTSLPEDISDELERKIRLKSIKYAIISTEPKAHFMYSKFFLKNELNILLDKPITSPINCNNDINQAKKIKEEYEELCRLYERKKHKMHFTIQCQRRFHEGFIFIKKLLTNTVKKYNIPITYIDIYHNDGMWVMPSEYISRENHPYKYGYGKLFHSGYHFIDLLTWFLEVNNLTENKKINNAEMYVSTFNPKDSLTVINDQDYQNLFRTHKFDNIFKISENKFKNYGEIDFHSIINFKKDDKTITNCTLNLMQSGFSRRSWSNLPKDIYKGNGRVRHERLNIEVGPLMNIQIHSYQAYEISEKERIFNNNVGSIEHFEIYIFRNCNLIGGKPFEKIDLDTLPDNDKEYFCDKNEQARENCFISFLDNKNDESDLLRHKNAIDLTWKAFEIMATKSKTSNFEFEILE